MKKDNSVYRQAAVKGALAGTCVLLAGFCVHCFFWKFTEYGKTDLPGLFYYLAATYGDAICLPVLTGSLVAYCHLSEAILTKRQKATAIAVGSISALAALAIQMSWLISDDTKLNWTIPEQHHFNLPGWYHAMFFVGMFFCIGMLTTRWGYIKKQEPVNESVPVKMILQTMIWFSSSMFLFLLSIDDYADGNNYFSVLLMVLGIYLVMVSIFFKLARGSFITLKYRCDNSTVLAGVFSAFAIAVIQYNGMKTDYYNIVSCMFLIVVLIIPEADKKGRMILYYVFTATPTVLLEIAITSQKSIWKGFVLLALAVAVPCIIASSQEDQSGLGIKRKNILSASRFLVGISLLMIIFTLNEVDIDTELFEVIVNLIFASAIPQYISTTFSMVKKEENNREGDPASADRIIKIQGTFYFTYLMLFLGGVVLISRTVLRGMPFTDGTEIVFDSRCLVSMLLFLVSMVLMLKKKRSECPANETKRFLRKSITLLGLAYTFTTISVVLFFNVDLKFFKEFSKIDYCLFFVSIYSAGYFAYLISKAYVNNVCSIRMISVTSFEAVTQKLICCGTFLTTSACACSVFIHRSMAALLLAIPVIGIAAIMIPWVYATRTASIPEQPQYVKKKQAAGVMQDGFLFSVEIVLSLLASVVLTGFLKEITYGLRELESGINDIVKYVSSFLLFISLANWPLEFCVENNVEHLRTRREEILTEQEHSNDNAERTRSYSFLHNLQKHLALQNRGAVMIAFPYTLTTILSLISKYIIGEEEDLKEAFFPSRNVQTR